MSLKPLQAQKIASFLLHRSSIQQSNFTEFFQRIEASVYFYDRDMLFKFVERFVHKSTDSGSKISFLILKTPQNTLSSTLLRPL